MPFTDRRDAGRQLARLLEHHRGDDVLVLGLPRGGVPVAYEVATRLGAPLDVMVARKLGAPSYPEFGIGAVAPGVRVLDEESVRALGVSARELDRIAHGELREMERRFLAYRGEARMPDVRARTVVLVDDGLATGVTARAALRSLRAQRPRRLVLAIPVCAPQTARAMREECDEVVYVEAHEDFRAVGLWYDDFRQTTDEEVLALLDEARAGVAEAIQEACPARIPVAGGRVLNADLVIPRRARAVVVFAHGSGSGRHSPRNRHVAEEFQRAGLGTLLVDLLTPEEEAADVRTRHFRFDVGMLSARVVAAVDWLKAQPFARGLAVGVFGASTGAAAALRAAAMRPGVVGAVVSRGGRPDLAGPDLGRVEAATLLLVGGRDEEVLALNMDALRDLRGTLEKDVVVIPGATHLFEEEGALDEVARLAAGWFAQHLDAAPRSGGSATGPSRQGAAAQGGSASSRRRT